MREGGPMRRSSRGSVLVLAVGLLASFAVAEYGADGTAAKESGEG